MNGEARAFGRHLRQLRRARGRTQEQLAARSGLSADTIRRLEHGSFSPSLDTLRKLCGGLGLQLSTLFESLELGEPDRITHYADLLRGRLDAQIELVTTLTRVLLDELDGGRLDEVDDDEDGDDE